MRQFFLAVGLIAVFTFLSILFYIFKYKTGARKNRIISERIKKKMYQDDRQLLQSRLRHALPDLQTGNLNWIVLSARNNQRIRIELTYNQINSEIEIRDHTEPLNEEQIKSVKKLGAENCSNDGVVNLICTSPNPKIISDIIYFIIEDVNHIRTSVNFKLSESGVYNGKSSRIIR